MIHAATLPDTHSGAHPSTKRKAFTLIEALVAIGIVAVVLPLIDVSPIRRAAIRTSLHNALRVLVDAVEDYMVIGRPYPTMEQLVDSGLLDEYGFTWDGRVLCHPHLDYCFVLEERMDARGLDGRILRLCAIPKPPYRDGSYILCLDYAIGVGLLGRPYELRDLEEAAEEEESRRKQVTWLVLDKTASFLSRSNDPDLAGLVLPFLDQTDHKAVIAGAVDEDQDGSVSKQEMLAFFAPRDSDTQLLAETREVLAEAFFTLNLDRGDYGSVPIADLPDDPPNLFSARNLGVYIDGVVSHAGVANSLTAKVRAAENARLRLGPEKSQRVCGRIVEAIRHEVRAQAGRTIHPQDARRLSAVVGVLAPRYEGQER